MNVLLTGGFGFIGSNLVEFLNSKGIVPWILEDWDNIGEKWRNVAGLRFRRWAGDCFWPMDVIVALGANVSTTEPMNEKLWRNNIDEIPQLLGRFRSFSNEPKVIYASSAAVYGGESKDFTERNDGLKPRNAYAFTKLELDKAMENRGYGLRFFNVYGPRETYKGNMASVVHKALTKQLPIYFTDDDEKGRWNLFETTPEARRDFIYVGDICKIIWFFMTNNPAFGTYNAGTGVARTFKDIVTAVEPLPIEHSPLPEHMRAGYQYFTQADLTKLRAAGYTEPFVSLEEGIELTRKYLIDNPA